MNEVITTVTAVVTAITAICAVWISVKTLKSNNKMIEESTRPNVSVYLEALDFSSRLQVIAIKNFGQSSALIENIECSKVEDLKKLMREEKSPIANLNGHTLAPGQFLIFYLHPDSIKENSGENAIETLDFEIEYSSVSVEGNKKSYKEGFSLFINATRNLPLGLPYAKREVTHTLQSIATTLRLKQ